MGVKIKFNRRIAKVVCFLILAISIFSFQGIGSAEEVKIQLPSQPSPEPFANIKMLQEQAKSGALQKQVGTEPTGMPLPTGVSPSSTPSVTPANEEDDPVLKRINAAKIPEGVVKIEGNKPMIITTTSGAVKKSKEEDATEGLDSFGNNEPKSASFSDTINDYKDVINDSKVQNVPPNKRTFVEFSRNYVNRVHCAGKIENMLIPEDRGMEAELLNDNHDLFLRVGAIDTRQFPLDISLTCDGNVYLINGVVHPHVPSQEINLVLAKGTRAISEQEKKKWAEPISRSEALPLEEQISRIMQRVYADDLLPYWKEVDAPTSRSRWSYGSFSVLLQKVINTNISDLLAWDFVFRGRVPSESFYDTIRQVVRGEIVAYGRVAYASQGATRVIVLTKQN